jgi:peptidoglycan/LPS O-acetylase OafA/YrhL
MREAMATAAIHTPSAKFTVVQQLRGLSIGLVLFWHTLTKAGLHYWIFGNPISIDTFFIVGGFIMFYSSHNDFGQPGAVSAYYFRRFARLIPLYWICVTVYVLAVSFFVSNHPPFRPSSILATLFFIPYDYSFANHSVGAVYSVGWFLDYLVLFDLVFGFFLFLPRRAGTIAASATLVLLVLVGLFPTNHPIVAAWTRPVALKFVAGLGLGYLYLYREKWGLVLKVREPLLWFVGLFTVAFVGSYLGGGGLSALNWRPFNSAVALCLASVAIFARAPKTSHFIARRLHAMGDASYSIYLSHMLVLLVAFKIWQKVGLGLVLSPWIFVGLLLPICIVIGQHIYRYFEAPMTANLIAWRTRMTSKQLVQPN